MNRLAVSCARSGTCLWVVEARPLPTLTRVLHSHLVICPLIRRPPSELDADIDAGMSRRRLDMTGRCMKRRAGDEDVSQREAPRIIHYVWPRAQRESKAGGDETTHATTPHEQVPYRWMSGWIVCMMQRHQGRGSPLRYFRAPSN